MRWKHISNLRPVTTKVKMTEEDNNRRGRQNKDDSVEGHFHAIPYDRDYDHVVPSSRERYRGKIDSNFRYELFNTMNELDPVFAEDYDVKYPESHFILA